jgi:RNase H-fold protein (predicted Holliday junction resolvase)
VSRKKRKGLVDKLAAQIILQGYLEAGRPEGDPA